MKLQRGPPQKEIIKKYKCSRKHFSFNTFFPPANVCGENTELWIAPIVNNLCHVVGELLR